MPVNRRNVLAGAAAAPLAAMALGTPPVAAAEGTQGVTSAAAAGYRVGMGIADITGPAAENGMMGYSMPDQKTAGIHLRTRSRAYVVVDEAGKRIVFVNADLGQVFLSVHTAVLKRLASKFGSLYTEQNVLLNATHTHAGCGGYSHYAAYNLSILGFQKQTFEAIVAGICESIEAAHADLKPATIRLGRTELTNASANRSRTAFDRNAAADKAHFPLGIDPAMTVLRIAQEGRDTGAISWFATHATSMTNANKLISGDNKGYASYAWEHEHHGVRYLEGKPGFVASFPQTNAGDMSPNLNLRPGSGPTENEFDNTRIIGDRQFQAAKRAYDSATATISGAVDYRMSFVDMSKVVVDGRYTPDGRQRTTAPAAVGASMLAGSTEDGPGVPLNEGITNPFIEALGGMDAPIPKELADAQAPKVVAVPFGLMKPHPWAPDVLPLQIVRIGQLYLIAAPAEFTIVAGLRLRRTVAGELAVPLENVLLQGYANAYAQYVTTHEEYDSQQYEGASTLYGRYTLAAYQQEFAKLAVAMRTGGSVGRGPTPPRPLRRPAQLPDRRGLRQRAVGQAVRGRARRAEQRLPPG